MQFFMLSFAVSPERGSGQVRARIFFISAIQNDIELKWKVWRIRECSQAKRT